MGRHPTPESNPVILKTDAHNSKEEKKNVGVKPPPSSAPKPAQQQMNSAELVRYYTTRLIACIEPERALYHLYNVGAVIKPFEDCDTEKVMMQYINDPKMKPLIQKLQNKFADLRRREAKKVPIEVNNTGESYHSKLEIPKPVTAKCGLMAPVKETAKDPTVAPKRTTSDKKSPIHNKVKPNKTEAAVSSKIIQLPPEKVKELRRKYLEHKKRKQLLAMPKRAPVEPAKPWESPKRSMFELPFLFKVRQLWPDDE